MEIIIIIKNSKIKKKLLFKIFKIKTSLKKKNH